MKTNESSNKDTGNQREPMENYRKQIEVGENRGKSMRIDKITINNENHRESVQISRMQWQLMENNENQRTSMNIKENQWNNMKINESSEDNNRWESKRDIKWNQIVVKENKRKVLQIRNMKIQENPSKPMQIIVMQSKPMTNIEDQCKSMTATENQWESM